jgi:hypothetical protein
MDVALAAGISAMMQAGAQQGVQMSVLKESMNTEQQMALKLLQTMPSVDANPNIGRNLNVVA